MADTSGKIYGLADNGVFTTETRKNVLNLSACTCGGNNEAIAGAADGKPCAMDTTPDRYEGIKKQDLEDDNMKRLASILLALELLTGSVFAGQMRLDAEVDRLCAIDGGLKIYETVTLPPEKFNKYGFINFVKFTKGENTLGSDYIWKNHQKFLHPGGDPNANPRMWRSHYQIFRRSDGKLLGESISYSRYGGDSRFFNELIGGPPESHHGCLEEETGDNKLIKGVFIKQSETGRTK